MCLNLAKMRGLWLDVNVKVLRVAFFFTLWFAMEKIALSSTVVYGQLQPSF